MQELFLFNDYRRFLHEYYEDQKRRKRFFSYRYFAQKAGIRSHSFLKSVIEGKRNLTAGTTEKFVAALGLNGREAGYFTALVRHNQAKTAKEKLETFSHLQSLGIGVQEELLKNGQYAYYAKWCAPILRELICLYDFKQDFELMGKSVVPAVSAEEAKSAVDLLLKLGLVERRRDGIYRQTKASIKADSAFNSLAVRAFMETALEHAKQALYMADKRERHISSVTLGISASGYKALIAEIQTFKDRVKSIVIGDEGTSRVYHLNLSLFPGSREMRMQEGATLAEASNPKRDAAAAAGHRGDRSDGGGRR